jgi:predicted transcriptional regulator
MTEKQFALAVLQSMPESATLEAMSEELAILAALRRGAAAADAGRTLSHAELRQRSLAWAAKLDSAQ